LESITEFQYTDAGADIIPVVSEMLYRHVIQYITNKSKSDYHSAILPSGGSDESTTLSILPRYPKDLYVVYGSQASFVVRLLRFLALLTLIILK